MDLKYFDEINSAVTVSDTGGGEVRGLVEFSIETPEDMPHYVR